MATYVVGDVHGCYRSLRKLLKKSGFDRRRDHLWLVGDLVNRGPDSLAVLRWVKKLDERIGKRLVVVLGNHDLHLLARHAGVAGPRRKDTLDDVLAAPDAAELVAWLRRRPLLHRREDHLLVHAGLLPSWTPAKAEKKARKVEKRLRSPDGDELLARNPPGTAKDDPIRVALAAFTRLRTCTVDGEPCDFAGPLDRVPSGCHPWFQIPGRRSAGVTVLCGHWAALGLHRAPGVIALDGGAGWGGSLTALRLEDDVLFQQPVTETSRPTPR